MIRCHDPHDPHDPLMSSLIGLPSMLQSFRSWQAEGEAILGRGPWSHHQNEQKDEVRTFRFSLLLIFLVTIYFKLSSYSGSDRELKGRFDI